MIKKRQLGQPIFITGIDTGVGKTIVSAVVVQAIGADYWKPIQAGDLELSDTKRVQSLVARKDVTFHAEAFRLTKPMSPHAAAECDQVEIQLGEFTLPRARNQLVIEGAGGLMVPLNDTQLMIDLITDLNARTIIVSKNYLGSINHTLLTIDALRQRNMAIAGLVFCGKSNPQSESAVLRISGIPLLARIPYWDRVTGQQIEECAAALREVLSEQLR